MAQMINVDKKSSSVNEKNRSKNPPLFRKTNYILMVLGVIVLFLGYILLSGGKAASDAEFNEAIFNTRRLIIAPTLMLLGLIIEVFAIMYHPKAKKEETTEE